MRSRIAVLALSCVLASAGARAAESSLSAADCAGQDVPQQTMNACAWQAFEKQDRALNAMYGRLVKQSDADSFKQLQAAQRAWLQFRDLECVVESPDAAGSLGPYETAACKAELTKERLLDLKRMLRDVR